MQGSGRSGLRPGNLDPGVNVTITKKNYSEKEDASDLLPKNSGTER